MSQHGTLGEICAIVKHFPQQSLKTEINMFHSAVFRWTFEKRVKLPQIFGVLCNTDIDQYVLNFAREIHFKNYWLLNYEFLNTQELFLGEKSYLHAQHTMLENSYKCKHHFCWWKHMERLIEIIQIRTDISCG